MKDRKYTISQFDFTEICAAARRALINANPNYYSWTAEQQEHYRATKDEQAIQYIKIVLINNLLNFHCDSTNVNDVWDNLPDTHLDILNWAMLLTDGVGEDYIFINESLATDKSILDFETLYDYDFSDHLFQEESRKERFSNYKPSDYYPFHWEPWFRLLIDNVFIYANLSSTGRYIADELEDFGFDYIQQLIPYELVEGKEHGKPSSDDYLQWDMQINASGLESQLEELKSRWYAYLEQRFITISKEQVGERPTVHIVENNEKQVCNRTYIFNNEDALKSVRWKHFLADYLPLIKVDNFLEVLLINEKQQGQLFLDNSYNDIIENFDPNVVKLKKKMKVMMPAEMLDNLNEPD
ncbi:hypothetical protein [Methylophaga sp.]|uniref:hypothetical protein n=1 Tax=Methylophaga sp. TaxID=2024840 RepID=UPI003A953B87